MDRGDHTKQLILDTAVAMFHERGYDATTMRAVATEAGVAVGNAYHYFSGKDELVQAFYGRIQDEHRARAAAVLRETTDLTARLRGVLHAGVDLMAPHHGFASTFARTAIDPASPSSPFSAQSTASADAAVGLFRDVVEGSSTTVPRTLAPELPHLLWLAYLGVTLFWVYDGSPGQARTRALIDSSVPLIVRLLRLARLPAVRSVVADLVGVVRGVRV